MREEKTNPASEKASKAFTRDREIGNQYLLLVLESNYAHFMDDEWVVRSDALSLKEEPLGQFDVVGQSTLQPNVQQW